jgi:replicative DNA helicase
LAERSNVKAAFIDYVQLLSAGNKKNFGSREQEISTISRGLKLIAKENGLPVIALSQLSRAVEARQDKRPLLSDLRDSGSLEQDADVVAFLYRAGYYDAHSPINTAEFIIAKHRNGRTGMLSVNFTPETMHYTSLTNQNNDIFEL